MPFRIFFMFSVCCIGAALLAGAAGADGAEVLVVGAAACGLGGRSGTTAAAAAGLEACCPGTPRRQAAIGESLSRLPAPLKSVRADCLIDGATVERIFDNIVAEN